MTQDEEQQPISIADEEAPFLTTLMEFGEPIFVGTYQPQYKQSTTMAGLDWKSTSPLAACKNQFAFALDQTHISALLLDLRESQVNIDELGVHLAHLKHLQELVIYLNPSQTAITCNSLPALQYLSISKNGRLQLSSLDKLQDLTVLIIDAQVDQFPRLPSTSNLQRLVMRTCTTSIFPAVICRLDNLVWLEIGNQFSTVPEDLGRLKELIILDIASVALQELPDCFTQLKKLQHLTLEANNLTEFPASIGSLASLTDLYLWNLPISELPAVICQLQALRYLWIKDNKKFRGSLRKLPDALGNLENLLDLQLNGNQIDMLPAGLGKLQKLKTLKLGVNNLRTHPAAIFDLKQLEHLELYLNPLEELTHEIEELDSLTYLDISDTKIRHLPETLARLNNLQHLDAIGCPLEDIPDSFTEIPITQFHSFQLTLTCTRDQLPEAVQAWIKRLEDQSTIQADYQMSISPYQAEEELFAVSSTMSPEIDQHIHQILIQQLNTINALLPVSEENDPNDDHDRSIRTEIAALVTKMLHLVETSTTLSAEDEPISWQEISDRLHVVGEFTQNQEVDLYELLDDQGNSVLSIFLSHLLQISYLLGRQNGERRQ